MVKVVKIKSASKLIHFCVVVAILTIAHFSAEKVNFSDVEPIIAILQNTSAMVFTIMGIWIAYIYPKAILKITQPEQARKENLTNNNVEEITRHAQSNQTSDLHEDDVKRITMIVGVVIQSAMVLATLIIILIGKSIITSLEIHKLFLHEIKILGYSIILILCYIQLHAIYIVIASNVNFIIDLKNRLHEVKLSKKLD